MDNIGVGLCGLGTVGSGFFNLVRDNAVEITRRTGQSLEVVHVGCRRDHPDCDLSQMKVSRDIFDVIADPDVDVVLELIGGTDDALELVQRALKSGKHVVTANKALIALHGDELFKLANAAGLSLRYEAAIAGGIPIVKAIREGLAGNRIGAVAGIINGTTNYILSEMERAGNRSFDDVLAEAQELGYAEADPTFDVEGIDAAHKLTILSSIAFGVPLNFKATYTEGISAVTSDDIRYAAELGYKIKHLGITTQSERGVELRVHPTLVGKDTMLAQVSGVMNAVLVSSDAAGQTMYYGAGAGAGPTASAVVADVIDIMRGAGNQIANLGFRASTLTEQPMLDITSVEVACYLRMRALDIPGVMARVSTILGQHNISIESLIQKDVRSGEVPIVIITNPVPEAQMNEAIAELEALEQLKSGVTRIRVESF